MRIRQSMFERGGSAASNVSNWGCHDSGVVTVMKVTVPISPLHALTGAKVPNNSTIAAGCLVRKPIIGSMGRESH